MKAILTLAALAAFQLASAQKTQEFQEIKSLTVGSDIALKLVKGTENKIVLDNEEIEAEYNHGSLEIKGDGSAILYLKNGVESIIVGSDAVVNGQDEIKVKSFHLLAGSDSEVQLNLNVQELQVTAGSDAQAKLTGNAGKMKATIGSDAEFNAKGLNIDNVSINVGSDGMATIKAKGTVDATVGSDGELTIYGNPKKVNEVKSEDSEITIVK